MCRLYKSGKPSPYIKLCYRFGPDAGTHIMLYGRDPETLRVNGHFKDPEPQWRQANPGLKQVNPGAPDRSHPRCKHGALLPHDAHKGHWQHQCKQCERDKWREAENAGA